MRHRIVEGQHLNYRIQRRRFGSRGTGARSGDHLVVASEKQRPFSAVQPVHSLSQRAGRVAAAASLRQFTDRILKIVEDLNIQIHSFHIKGKMNIIPDSLSRLATSGDYSLKEEIL
ncbi:MAG: hypothetical protein EZS28_049686, partial [Streblomastix strix]